MNWFAPVAAIVCILASPMQATGEDCNDYGNGLKLMDEVYIRSGFGWSCLADGRLFATGEGGLSVVDLSDPTRFGPVTTMPWGPYQGCGGLAVRDSTAYAFVNDGFFENVTGRLIVVDVDSATRQRVVRTLDFPGRTLFLPQFLGNRLVGLAQHYPYSYSVIVWDITDRLNPVVLSETDAGPRPWGFHAAGEVLAEWYGDGTLNLFRLTADGRIELASNQTLPQVPDGGALCRDRLYLAYADGPLAVLDTSDPAHPRLRGQTTLPSGPHRYMTVSENRLYVSAGANQTGQPNGVVVVDVADPDLPREIGFGSGTDQVDRLIANGELVYSIIGGESGAIIQVIDTSAATKMTPPEPNYLGLGDWAKLIDINDQVICGANRDRESLVLVDIRKPVHAIATLVLPIGYTRAGIWFVSQGNLVYCVRGGWPTLDIIDVADPAAPLLISSTPTQTGHAGIAVRGNFAYLGRPGGNAYEGMIEVWDISDPIQPRLAGTSIVPFGPVMGLEMNENVLVASCTTPEGSSYAVLYDISDAETPRKGTHLYLGDSPALCVHSGAYLFCGQSDWRETQRQLRIYDVHDVDAPVVVSEFDGLPSTPHDVETDGRYAYVTTDAGLSIVDLAEPQKPSYINTISWTSPWQGALSHGGEIFGAAAGALFSVPVQCDPEVALDPLVVNPAVIVNPGAGEGSVACGGVDETVTVVVITSAEFDAGLIEHETVRFGPGEASEIHSGASAAGQHSDDVDGDGDLDLLLHFSAKQAGIPCESSSATLSGWTTDGRRVVATSAIRTVEAVRNRDFRVAPNPCNGGTSIAFRLENSSEVRITIYDARGCVIAVPAAMRFGPGEHAVSWRGDDVLGRRVSSGNYFIRLVTEDEVRSCKIVLLE
jgi:hypothetical protein